MFVKKSLEDLCEDVACKIASSYRLFPQLSNSQRYQRLTELRIAQLLVSFQIDHIKAKGISRKIVDGWKESVVVLDCDSPDFNVNFLTEKIKNALNM